VEQPAADWFAPPLVVETMTSEESADTVACTTWGWTADAARALSDEGFSLSDGSVFSVLSSATLFLAFVEDADSQVAQNGVDDTFKALRNATGIQQALQATFNLTLNHCSAMCFETARKAPGIANAELLDWPVQRSVPPYSTERHIE
jgi:hypothetical protein